MDDTSSGPIKIMVPPSIYYYYKGLATPPMD